MRHFNIKSGSSTKEPREYEVEVEVQVGNTLKKGFKDMEMYILFLFLFRFGLSDKCRLSIRVFHQIGQCVRILI